MKKLAFVFAGQGSQYLGMGLDFVHEDLKIKKLSHCADDILGFHTEEMLNSELIHQTRYTQPLVLLSSIYSYEAVKTLGVTPDAVCGFSLGEYSALYASSIFTFKEIVELINMRALLMEESTKKHPGMMAAVIGLDVDQIQNLCQEVNHLYPANFNSLVQTVLSGTEEAINQAEVIAKELGAKRFIKLNVSGAFHSPLMKDASASFEKLLQEYEPKEVSCDVYLNTTGEKLQLRDLKKEMAKQIIEPVQFVKAIQNMKKDGITHIVEIGPGTVLSGLIRKIDMDIEVTHIEKYTDLSALKGWLQAHEFIK